MESSNFQSIFKWLSEQPKAFIDRLYGSGRESESEIVQGQAIFAVKAVFQYISHSSKNIVYRILFNFNDEDKSHYFISFDEIKTWFRDPTEADNSINELKSFHILQEGEDNNIRTLRIHDAFQRNLKLAILYPKEPWSESSEIIDSIHSEVDLDHYRLEKWNGILKYLMNLSSPIEISALSTSIVEFLKRHLNLITERHGINALTALGYEFMLRDYQNQVWELIWKIIVFLKFQEESLAFLFMLSYCRVGKPYPAKSLTLVQQKLLKALKEIGIIYADKHKYPNQFIPTSIAVNLIFKIDDSMSSQQAQGLLPVSYAGGPHRIKVDVQIIVETNMQVIAYVNNELHLALLKLFVDVQIRMPNMVKGVITRNKTKEAFEMGISVAQVIDFLRSHAHPVIREADPVPKNVIDQLCLWYDENHRIKSEEAVFVDFAKCGMTINVFRDIHRLASRLGLCLWVDEVRALMVLTPAGFDKITEFLNAHS